MLLGVKDGVGDLAAITAIPYSDCVDVIQTAVDEGHAIGFEHGSSAQASYLTSQGVIEEMFQDIITNGTDVETAAKAAEDKLNDIFDTMIS